MSERKLSTTFASLFAVAGATAVVVVVGRAYGVALIMAILIVGCGIELTGAFSHKSVKLFKPLVVGVPLLSLACMIAGSFNAAVAVVAVSVFVTALYPFETTGEQAADVTGTVFSIVYLAGPAVATYLVAERDLRLFPLGIAVVIATDTTGLLIGRKIGRHKFTSLSPNKSWEGLAAGVIIAGVVGAALGLAVGLPAAWVVPVSFGCSLSAIFGDLTESRIKREVGIKDSGTIVPGHGGLLDMFDSCMGAFLFLALTMAVLPA